MISKLINTSGFAIVLIAFLLPFVSIKCNDKKLEEFKGYHLITGKEYTIANPMNKEVEKSSLEMGSEQTGKLETNWLMISLLLITLSGIIVSVIKLKKKRIPEAATALLGFLCLIVLVTLLGNELETKGDVGSSLLGLRISLGYEIGFWIMLIVFLGIGIYNLVLMVLDSKKPIPPSSPLNDYEPPTSIDKIE